MSRLPAACIPFFLCPKLRNYEQSERDVRTRSFGLSLFFIVASFSLFNLVGLVELGNGTVADRLGVLTDQISDIRLRVLVGYLAEYPV